MNALHTSDIPSFTPVLDLQVQRKLFGDSPVLGPLELRLQTGEIVSLLGPSGCGKEPFSAVDAFTRFALQDLLLDLARRRRIALLVVTHDIDEALYLSDRVLVIGNRPGTVRRELAVPLAYPRDRRDARLADLRGQALEALQAAHVI
ncbi:hypothetical protein [Pseudomonas alabamensis]|uniref:hypothetical protein n=1 Tax=Pseudomonas alabamensis TaxID=3064349 RepID=UPI0021D8B1BF|nr:hypothetical protein [Pseudomonas entomophila]